MHRRGVSFFHLNTKKMNEKKITVGISEMGIMEFNVNSSIEAYAISKWMDDNNIKDYRIERTEDQLATKGKS